MAVSLRKALSGPTATSKVCRGALTGACKREATVVQTHRVPAPPAEVGMPATIDVQIAMCASHAARLKVGNTVRGVKILRQKRLR